MCRAIDCGGRRCPFTEEKRQRHNRVQQASYARRKARADAAERIAELGTVGVAITSEQDTPMGWRVGVPDLNLVEITADPERGDHWVPKGGMVTDTVPSDGGTIPSPRARDILAPGTTVALGDEQFEVMRFSESYDGQHDQVTLLATETGMLEVIDMEHGAADAGFRRIPTPPAARHITETFAERWKADNGSGFVASTRNHVQNVLDGSGVHSDNPEDIYGVRLLRNIAATDPDDTALYRGIYVGDTETDDFVARVRAEGFTEALGSYSPDRSTAALFAAGGDAMDPKFRNPAAGVLLVTEGPTRSVDLWPGSDEPERVSGGRFSYVSDHTDDQGMRVIVVRQERVDTPETLMPVPLAAAAPHDSGDAPTLIAPIDEPKPDIAEHGDAVPVRACAGALVAVIDDKAAHDALVRRYPHPTRPDRVSFEAMKEDGIHGVRLTGNGHAAVGGVGGPMSGWVPGMLVILVGAAFVVASEGWRKKTRRKRR